MTLFASRREETFFYFGESELIAWLQSTSLLKRRHVVRIEYQPARRLVALIWLDDGSALLVKQLFQVDQLHQLTEENLTREVSFLQLIDAEVEMVAFKQVTPAFLAYFSEKRFLVIEGLTEYITLRNDEQASTDPQIIQKVATSLARCHTASRQAVSLRNSATLYHQEAPIPTYGHITPTMLANAPGRDYTKYLRIVQEINSSLRELKSSWNQQCFIHGDFKFDNILFFWSEHGEHPEIRFVDWELSGWGDPLWDVGSLVGQWMLQWILSINVTSQKSLQTWLREANVPFEHIRSAATCFVEHYIEQSANNMDAQALRQKIVRYAGAFLLHRAMAMMEIMGFLTTKSHFYIHIGKTLIAQPQVGVQLLLSAKEKQVAIS